MINDDLINELNSLGDELENMSLIQEDLIKKNFLEENKVVSEKIEKERLLLTSESEQKSSFMLKDKDQTKSYRDSFFENEEKKKQSEKPSSQYRGYESNNTNNTYRSGSGYVTQRQETIQDKARIYSNRNLKTTIKEVFIENKLQKEIDDNSWDMFELQERIIDNRKNLNNPEYLKKQKKQYVRDSMKKTVLQSIVSLGKSFEESIYITQNTKRKE